MPKTVVFGILGKVMDRSKARGAHRWDRWRPTVSIFQHEDLAVDRLELLISNRDYRLAQEVTQDIAQVSPETEVRTTEITFHDPWDFEAVYGALYQFARDYPFDLENERYLVHITTGTHVAQICLFLLTESRHLPAQLLQTSPAPRGSHDAGNYTIIDLDLGRYDQLTTRFDQERTEGRQLLQSGISTRNEAFNRQVSQIEQVAVASRAQMLLMGPTGAGKSQLASRIHALKKQRHRLQGPFVEVNCATLRGDAAMSALFGHKRGAFTGATSDRPGLLKSADGGLLFLDEIGELGRDEQAMLLRAVEERRFLPVGADVEVHSDFQLIAGTNRDLYQEVAAGRFRADLLARIDMWTFHLPGLRERPEDLEPNVDFELDQFARREGRKVRFNREAREAYLRFATSGRATWAGNFRDLNASVTRMATLSPSGRISEGTVHEEIDRLERAWHSQTPTTPGAARLIDRLGARKVEALDRFDRSQLEDVLAVCARSASLSAAGRELFAVSRTKRKVPNDADRLRKYLLRFGLTWADVAQTSAD
ncbi:MAG: RNA repair transcriptional activator RtcR [Planctomycetes bacterium]|nr:RNA repair transcriptional activator RtcR [Planctomycetota bacterium]